MTPACSESWSILCCAICARPALQSVGRKDEFPGNAMSEKPSFFAELKRRNVYKVAVAYAVVGWLIAQIATQIFPFLEIPNWIVRLVIVLIAIGFPIALIIAWAFEATPEGIKRTEDVDLAASARQPRKHAWIVVVIVGAALSVGLFFVGRYTAQNTGSAFEQSRSKTQSRCYRLKMRFMMRTRNTSPTASGGSVDQQPDGVAATESHRPEHGISVRGKQADPQAIGRELKVQDGLNGICPSGG